MVINEWSARRILWLDNVSLKEATYNADDKTYTVTGNNLLKGGDLDFEVKNAQIDADGYITWEETYSSIIKNIKIYEKDGETLTLIDTVDPGVCFAGIDNPAKDHVIKVITQTSDGANVARFETAGVTVKGVSGESLPDKVIGTISLDKQGVKAAASVNVRNNKIQDGVKAMLVVAEYTNTGLVKLTKALTTVSIEDNETLSAELTLANAENTVKAFLWDGWDTMIPLTKSVSK